MIRAPRLLTLCMSAALLASPILFLPAPSHAQAAPATDVTPGIPRTADGRPDFGGYWGISFLTPVGRLEGATRTVVSEAEARELVTKWIAMANSPALETVVDPDFFVSGVDTLSRVNGEYRTAMLTTPADGVQHYTAEGQRLESRRKAWNDAAAEGPEMRDHFERCILGAGGAPLTSVPSTLTRLFVQTPDHLVLATETNDTRIVRIGEPAGPAAITSLLGDSVARWRGDVLVVETTGVKERVIKNIITRPGSRVIERFQMISPDELFYRFTVEDTAIYAEPWSAEYVLHRSTHRIYEYACHEGNYGLTNILQGARVADKKKPKAKPSAAQ